MARLVGPESGSRLAYAITGTGSLLSADGAVATVYSDADATDPADILTVNGDPIADSQVTIGADTQLPLFQFPDGLDLLYVQVGSGPIVAIYARNSANAAVTSVDEQVGAVDLSTTYAPLSTASSLTAHEAATTSVHGIVNTAALETQAGATSKVATHTAASDPHGDRAYAAAQAGSALSAAEGYTDSAIATVNTTVSGKLAKSSNLSDLASASTGRTNLGLGTAAVKDAPAGGNATSGQVALGSDTRLSDSRTPTTHATSHATGGSDAVSASSIGALAAASNLSDVASASTARTNLGLGTAATQASSAFDAAGSATTAQGLSLQKAGNLSDVASPSTSRTNLGLGTSAAKDVPSSGNASSAQVVFGTDTRLSDTRTPSSTLAHASTHGTAGSDPVSLDAGQVATGTLAIGRIPTGVADASHVPLGNDSRLSDSRTPTAHATSHKTGGSDAFTAADVGGLLIASNLSDLNNASTARTNLGLGSAATHATTDYMATGSGLLIASNLSDLASASTARTNLGLGTAAVANIGTASGTVATGLPGGGWGPVQQGFITWNFDPVYIASASGQFIGGSTPGKGIVALQAIVIPQACTITNVICYIGAAGTSVAAGAVGLYSTGGTLLSGSSAVTTAWQSIGLSTVALTTPQAVSAGTYYVALLVGNSTTTGPQFMRGGSSGVISMMNANLSAATSRWATTGSGLSALAAITMSGITATSVPFWVALS